jgi:hypothetical protein
MSKDGNLLQNITTLLAYTLPLLQFFFVLLPAGIISFFAFHDYFLIVSIFTAIISYILILVVKSTPYFFWYPFQKKLRHESESWRIYTDRAVHTIQDIRKYQKDHKPPKLLKVINNDNIVIKLLVPILAIGFVIFCTGGAMSLAFGEYFQQHQGWGLILQLVQAIAYSAFLVSAVLAFANQFLRESGIATFRRNNAEKYNKAITLVRNRNGFDELKSISLIRQFQRNDPSGSAYTIFFLEVDKEFYLIVTDADVDMVYNIDKFNTKTEAETFIAS